MRCNVTLLCLSLTFSMVKSKHNAVNDKEDTMQTRPNKKVKVSNAGKSIHPTHR